MSPRRKKLLGTLPTPAELEALDLLEEAGATYDSVAEDLGVSASAIKHRVTTLYARLGVNSGLQARAALGWRPRGKLSKKTGSARS